MLAICLLPVLLALPELATAGPFTFPSQPSLRHVTLTAQDGQHLVLTITQTSTATATTTQTPTTIPVSSGPRRTSRPGEAELELELRDDVFAPTTPSSSSSDSQSDPDSSTSSSSSSSTEEESGEEPAAAAVGSSPETPAQVQTVARAQTTPPPPKNDPQVASALAQQGYSQITYYTCKTRDATLTHCGWHVPVVKASGATSWRHGGDMGRILGAALAATISVVLGSLVM
ncbi:hypothetical protein LA080_003638 [Diaporthe eres]|uniref:Uncharacterized protein n=1 Tax=Diaporthe vaccinii TaxID=105482 RepID=A0ABR4E937_9PEZI|nr:hypothetical protein LA080_003638 [Diaporthe eres]